MSASSLLPWSDDLLLVATSCVSSLISHDLHDAFEELVFLLQPISYDALQLVYDLSLPSWLHEDVLPLPSLVDTSKTLWLAPEQKLLGETEPLPASVAAAAAAASEPLS